MAEIEVLHDFGVPYVRLDDYNEMKERYWRQVALTQVADDEAAQWKDHARALLARVEAAEAEVRRNAMQSHANFMALRHIGGLLAGVAGDSQSMTVEDYRGSGVGRR